MGNIYSPSTEAALSQGEEKVKHHRILNLGLVTFIDSRQQTADSTYDSQRLAALMYPRSKVQEVPIFHFFIFHFSFFMFHFDSPAASSSRSSTSCSVSPFLQPTATCYSVLLALLL
jgi:hypothetical protein